MPGGVKAVQPVLTRTIDRVCEGKTVIVWRRIRGESVRSRSTLPSLDGSSLQIRDIVIPAPVVNRVRPQATDDEPDPAAIHAVRALRPARVFDLRQTDGEPLPEIASRLLGDDAVDAVSNLVACAAGLDFTVSADRLGPDLNGFCDHSNRRIVLNADLEPRMSVKTLCHELAHALMHGPERREDLPRELCELEAESVAFAETDGLGIDSGAYSFGYITSWVGGGDAARHAIRASGQRITQAARAILEALEPMAALPDEHVA
jgi:IrrE N-terminal-like domain